MSGFGVNRDLTLVPSACCFDVDSRWLMEKHDDLIVALKRLTIAQKLARFLMHLAIGLVAALLVGLVTWYTPDSIRKNISGGWIGLAVFTPTTFWIVARQYRNLWRRLSFWLTLVSILVIHLLGFTLVLRNFPEFRMLWYVPIMIVEVVLVALLIEEVVHRDEHAARNCDEK
jgi:cation transport ATPase